MRNKIILAAAAALTALAACAAVFHLTRQKNGR